MQPIQLGRCRALLARLRDDEGIGIVEMLFAAFIVLVAMGAGLTVITASMVQSRSTRTVDVASNFGNEQVEYYRSFIWEKVALGPDYTGPPVITMDGEDYPVVTDDDCTECPLHEETTTVEGRTIDVTRWVLEVDDSSDGLDGDDEDGDTVDYKRVVVEMSWSAPTSGSQTLHTNILPDGVPVEDEGSDPHGLRLEVRYPGPGELIDELDESIRFPVEVLEGGTPATSGETIEGTVDLLGLADKAYQCRVSQAHEFWTPKDEPQLTAKDYPCTTVPEDEIAGNEFVVEWEYRPCIAPGTGTADGTVRVQYTEEKGKNKELEDATVTVTGPTNGDGSPITRTGTTDKDGVTFTDLPRGLYDVDVDHQIDDDKKVSLGSASGQLCVRAAGGETTVTYLADLEPKNGVNEIDWDEDCPEVETEKAETATVCVTVTNDHHLAQFFRILVEKVKQKDGGPVESKERTYEPDKHEDQSDAEHQGILIQPGESYTFIRGVKGEKEDKKPKKDEYFLVKVERKRHDDGWNQRAEWQEGLFYQETAYEYAAAVE